MNTCDTNKFQVAIAACLAFARAQWQVAKAMYDASAACIDPGQAGQAMHSLTQAMERMAALREQFAKAAK